jgi:hypothetical protein
MAGAGMVDYPEELEASEFYEIMHPKKRTAIMDYALLLKTPGIETFEKFQDLQQISVRKTSEI